MKNIITINGKQLAAINGQSVGSYNGEEVTQAINNASKQPLFDSTGNENISGLVYPFSINVKCNDDRLTITDSSSLSTAIYIDSRNQGETRISNAIKGSTLRPVSSSAAHFSLWNGKFTSSLITHGNYKFEMEDLPAYTYNLDGAASTLYVTYTPGDSVLYRGGANYSGNKTSVEVDAITWKGHYMTDVFGITTAKWSNITNAAPPIIQYYPNTYQDVNLESRKLTESPLGDDYSGNFITFDFSNYIGKKVWITYIVYANEQAKAEGKQTFFRMELRPNTPTANDILDDFYDYESATNMFSGDSDLEVVGADITETNHIFTLYPYPGRLGYFPRSGYPANRFDIRFITIEDK